MATTMEEAYAVAKQLPREEQQRLAEKLNGDLASEVNGDALSAPNETAPELGDENAASKPQRKMPEWMRHALEAAEEIEKRGLHLPTDLSDQHDHYLYGTPKR